MAQAAAEFDAGDMKLQPGFSLDLTRADPTTGQAWDLPKPQVQRRVTELVQETRPLFLIGFPPCTAFSALQNLSKSTRGPAVVKAKLDARREHLIFCMNLYEIQIKGGRFFVHEHPQEAASWSEACIVRIAAMEGVEMASVDMCAYGMRVDTGAVQGPARKRTKIMSNSDEVIKRIAVKCPNFEPDVTKHLVHVTLESGRAKRCQVYSREFRRKICAGIAAEKRLRELGMISLPLLDVDGDNLESDMKTGSKAAFDLHEYATMHAFDDQPGDALDPILVREARLE